MRILVLSIEYPPVGGGASPQSHEINLEYIRHGHSVTVVTMHTGSLPLREIKDGIEIIRVRCFRRHTHISYLWEHISFILASRTLLKKLLTENKFDVCHSHFILPTGLISKWVKKKFGIPYIISAHGSDVPGYNPDRFQHLHRMTHQLIKSIIQQSDYIVFPSQFLRSLLIEKFSAFEHKLIYIPSGIDTEYYAPANKKPILLSTGRILPRKGFQHLIHVVSGKAYPVEVHICGDGPYLAELKEKARGSKTPIIFHGWIDNKSEEYKTLLSEASIFSLVSGKENASTSLLEAMSSGCAIITSNVSGCPESVGEAGICIPPADEKALEEQIEKLIDHPEYQIQLMNAARMRALTHFAWPAIADRYIRLLSKMQAK
jgi:glycosyltransferase involved in cell wall biosynthesis